MSSTDRSYTILLSHLHTAEPKLPLPTIQGALAHHLASAQPTPTSLTAIAISSPLYLAQPFTHNKLQSLSTALRHATHLKHQLLVDEAKKRTAFASLLSKSLPNALESWLTDALLGIQGGHPVLRLSCCSGLLLGVEDLRVATKADENAGSNVEISNSGIDDEAVIALAEIMDTYAYAFGSASSPFGVEEWEREFQPAGQDILSLALIVASQSFPVISQEKLKALPLPVLSRILASTIASTFKNGGFLSSVSASITLSSDQQVHLLPTSPFALTLQSMTASPLNASIASLTRFTSNVLALLTDSPPSRPNQGITTVYEIFANLKELVTQVERDWISCPLANCTEEEIAPDSKDLAQSLWMNLKTLLFSNVMLAESVLSNIVFVPSQDLEVSPSVLAIQVLDIMSHLSFIISEFGGVTTTSKGFEQLKKTFYLALDILAHGEGAPGDAGAKAEAYVQQACFGLNSQRSDAAATKARQAKEAFVLASIEQLIPVLSDKCIRNWVWGVCYPHLSNPTNRETYESSHSVVLTIFASHAQRQQLYAADIKVSEDAQPPSRSSHEAESRKELSGSKKLLDIFGSENTSSSSEDKALGLPPSVARQPTISMNFVQRMVPFYAQCLIANSVDGRLETSQLQLAYSSLVRSASAKALMSDDATTEEYALAWYCIQRLLDAIHEASAKTTKPTRKGKGRQADEIIAKASLNQTHRLCLTLASTVSSLPSSLMLRALDELRTLIVAYPSAGDDSGDEKGEQAELLETLFHELLHNTGDREKEAAMRWWYQNRPGLLSGDEKEREVSGGWASWFGKLKSRGGGGGGGLNKLHQNGEGIAHADSVLVSRL